MHLSRPLLQGPRFPRYAVMLYVGLVAALVTGDLLARRAGLDPVRTVTAMVLLIPVCLAGARGLVVALHWSRFRARPAEILRVDHGGAAMYGGLLPAVLLSVPLLGLFGLPFSAFWDVAAVAILAGMIPTRLGCLWNGCCAGRRSSGPLGIQLRNAHGVRERRLPNPVFEAALAGALLLLSILLWTVRPFPGAVCLFVVAGYAAARFLLEGLREKRDPVVAGLGAYQWISLALFVPCALSLAAGWAAADAPVSIAAASAADGTGYVLASALLLLPVLYLFRFLGCDLVFPLNDPETKQVLRLGATVPGPSGTVTAEMKIVKESSLEEIEESPVDLGAAFALPDGRVAFGTTVEIAEGSYRATCTIRRGGVTEREAEATGDLNAPDLVVLFEAPAGDATGILNQRLSFQAASPESAILGVAVPDIGGTGPFTATMTLESQFNEGGTDTSLPSVGPVGQLEGFQATVDVPVGFYRSTCTVTRQGAITRVGQCSSDHNSPGEEVAFVAQAGDPLNELTAVRCFKIP